MHLNDKSLHNQRACFITKAGLAELQQRTEARKLAKTQNTSGTKSSRVSSSSIASISGTAVNKNLATKVKNAKKAKAQNIHEETNRRSSLQPIYMTTSSDRSSRLQNRPVSQSNTKSGKLPPISSKK